MYSIKKIIVEDKLTIRTLDDGVYVLRDILARWDTVMLVLSTETMEEDYKLVLSDYPELYNYTATISEFIFSLDMVKYPPEVYVPAEENVYVVSKDVWEEGYTADGANALHDIGSLEDDNVLKPDILLRRGDEAYVETATHSLISVNGLYHPLSASTDGIFIMNGKRNADSKRECQMSLVDFSDVGKIEYISINEGNVIRPNPVGRYFYDGVYVKLPASVEGKTIMVCLCGHLFMLSDIMSYFDKDIIRIDIRNIDLEMMVMEHHEALGLSHLLDEVTGAMTPRRMRSDAAIMDILKSTSTFIVSIDTPKLYKEVIQLTYEGLPGVYSNTEAVYGIAHYSNYKVADYLQDHQDGIYCIRTTLDRYENYRHLTTDWERQNVVTTARKSINPTEPPFLYMTNLYARR